MTLVLPMENGAFMDEKESQGWAIFSASQFCPYYLWGEILISSQIQEAILEVLRAIELTLPNPVHTYAQVSLIPITRALNRSTANNQ